MGDGTLSTMYDDRCSAVALARLAILTAGLMLTPVRVQGQPSAKYFDADGVQIRYVEKGMGDPLVLLHGNTRSLEQWTDSGVFDSLAVDHWVIAFDSRGHGKSGKPRDENAYGKEMAFDIVRLLDHLEIEKAHILGYSMGARVGGGSLPDHQDRFQTLILGGFGPAREWSAEDQERIEARANRILTDRPQWMLDRGLDLEAMASLIRSFSDLAVDDAGLAATQVPVLGIVGNQDRNLSTIEALGQVIPNFKLVVIQGATHSGTTGAYLHPEFLSEVRKFIAEHPLEN